MLGVWVVRKRRCTVGSHAVDRNFEALGKLRLSRNDG